MKFCMVWIVAEADPGEGEGEGEGGGAWWDCASAKHGGLAHVATLIIDNRDSILSLLSML